MWFLHLAFSLRMLILMHSNFFFKYAVNVCQVYTRYLPDKIESRIGKCNGLFMALSLYLGKDPIKLWFCLLILFSTYVSHRLVIMLVFTES